MEATVWLIARDYVGGADDFNYLAGNFVSL
jgi:hypothetical protein